MDDRLRLVSICLIACAALYPFSCSKKEHTTEEIVRPVRYLRVFSTDSHRTRSFSGIARSEEESEISFKVSGTVIELPVKLGDNIGKEDLIARLDPKDYELRVQEAEASLARARAQERNAAANYERVRQLYENQNASLSDLDLARTQAESTQAQVRSADKQLELARLQLSYTRLTAPDDGSIASLNVEINEYVKAGDTVVLLSTCCSLEVEVAIPESLISSMREGNPASVIFDSLPGERFPAVVNEVGVAPTEFATTYPVTVRLEKTDPSIRSGMSAEVTFRFGTAGGGKRFIVPPVAVGEDPEGKFVFIVEPTDAKLGIARKRPVSVGELTSAGLEITEGLFEGDLVVTGGINNIRDGLKVKILERKGDPQ